MSAPKVAAVRSRPVKHPTGSQAPLGGQRGAGPAAYPSSISVSATPRRSRAPASAWGKPSSRANTEALGGL